VAVRPRAPGTEPAPSTAGDGNDFDYADDRFARDAFRVLLVSRFAIGALSALAVNDFLGRTLFHAGAVLTEIQIGELRRSSAGGGSDGASVGFVCVSRLGARGEPETPRRFPPLTTGSGEPRLGGHQSRRHLGDLSLRRAVSSALFRVAWILLGRLWPPLAAACRPALAPSHRRAADAARGDFAAAYVAVHLAYDFRLEDASRLLGPLLAESPAHGGAVLIERQHSFRSSFFFRNRRRRPPFSRMGLLLGIVPRDFAVLCPHRASGSSSPLPVLSRSALGFSSSVSSRGSCKREERFHRRASWRGAATGAQWDFRALGPEGRSRRPASLAGRRGNSAARRGGSY
jgi:hypothetical protein